MTADGGKMSDHASMKRKNQLSILRHIRDAGPITRVNLKKSSGLGWSTITTSTKELISKGIITELGSVSTGVVGRRPVELDLNRRKNFVLGLRLGGMLVRAVLVDVKGIVVQELQIPVNAQGTTREILDTLLRAGKQILRRRSVGNSSLAGIGIAAPGAVDFFTGVCYYSPHHPQWKDVPLKKTFEQAFNVSCFVDHTYNCFALSEKLFGLGRGLDNFVGVLMGTGLSAGLVIDGEVYRGANCCAGEFGHTNIDPDGPLCACGNKGCVEAYVSGPAIACLASKEAAKRNSLIRTLAGGDVNRITAETLEQAARRDDALALDIFSRMGSVLGLALSNLINVFNPQSIILGGRLANASEFFLPSCLETLEKRVWHISTRDLKVSQLQNSAVLGAAALVLQQLFNTGQILQRPLRT
jgi:predicted NBD/HSP70 family sugar kinase